MGLCDCIISSMVIWSAIAAGVRSAALLDRAAGQIVCDLLQRDGERADVQTNFHHDFFPRDPWYYNVHPPHTNKHSDQGVCFHTIDSWPQRPRCLNDVLADPRNFNLQGLRIQDTGGYSKAFDSLANEIAFVIKTCGPEALRMPESIPGDGDLSQLPTLVLPPSFSQCSCSQPTPMNLQRAQGYDDRRAVEAQCSDPSLRDMLAEDGPRIREHLRYLLQFLRKTMSNSLSAQ